MDQEALDLLRGLLRARTMGRPVELALEGIDLSEAKLARADLSGAVLNAATLDRCRLEGARLEDAVLDGASLKDACLDGAVLTCASLREADLHGLRVEGATFADADLRGANLSNWRGTPASFAGARIDYALAKRSDLSDPQILILHDEGATIVDLDSFSDRVQRRVNEREGRNGDSSEVNHRDLLDLERAVHRARRATVPAFQVVELEAETVPAAVSDDDAPSSVSRRVRRLSNLNVAAAVASSVPEAAAPAPPRTPTDRPPPLQSVPPTPAAPPTEADHLESTKPAVAADAALEAPVSPPMHATAAVVTDVHQNVNLDSETYVPGAIVLGVTIVEHAGKGAVSDVWRAEGSGGEPVALKLFDRAHMGLGLSGSRFQKGVRAMLRLTGALDRPPTIMPIQAVSENRLAFLIPWAANGTTADLPALGLTPDKIVTFFRRVAEAIAFGHSYGVLHFCLQPQNILLTADLEPVVSDFDLLDLQALHDAQLAAPGGHEHLALRYVAPEELRGEGLRSPTADIYSLGRLLEYLLTGDDPARVRDPIPPLATARRAHEGLARIIRKCTMAEPRHRYGQVEDLLADLERYDADGAEVGIAPETLSLPTPVSEASRLPTDRPWLSFPEIHSRPPSQGPDSRTSAGPLSAAGRAAGRAATPLATKSAPRGLAPDLVRKAVKNESLDRGVELRLGWIGLGLIAIALGTCLVMALPSQRIATFILFAFAGGVALTTFFVPDFGPNARKSMRIAVAVAAGGAALLVGITPIIEWRLKRTLHHSQVVTQRARAVERLAARGLRQFGGANLKGAQLVGLDLGGADFSSANLAEATFQDSIADSTTFADANIQGLDISGADLSSSDLATHAKFGSVVCSETTVLPVGWLCLAGHPAKDEGDRLPKDSMPEGTTVGPERKPAIPASSVRSKELP